MTAYPTTVMSLLVSSDLQSQ